MSVTVSTVEASDPQGVTAAAGRLDGHIADLDAAVDEQKQALERVRAAWQAAGGDAAVATAEEDLVVQVRLRSRLESVRAALASGGVNLDAIRIGLTELVTALRGMGWTITDDGIAVAPFFPPVLKNFEPGFTAVIQRLLGLFDQIDGTTADAVRAAVEH
ncbi:MAG: hypothetical protein PGN37_23990 [Mycobacterium kyogaense]|uniref:hypothetical protein n=1 Tax=Mycobacterium kyogaense TaxID=2212479 RepID=UPI002FFA25CE